MSDGEGGFVAGEIIPNGETQPPRFRVVHRREKDAGPNVRACDHPTFVLDDKWSTVTCGRCGERLDPYAVLRNHAEYWSEMEHKRVMAEDATKRFYRESLRRLSRKRGVLESERAEIKDAVEQYWRFSAKEMEDLDRRIERAIRQRRYPA